MSTLAFSVPKTIPTSRASQDSTAQSRDRGLFRLLPTENLAYYIQKKQGQDQGFQSKSETRESQPREPHRRLLCRRRQLLDSEPPAAEPLEGPDAEDDIPPVEAAAEEVGHAEPWAVAEVGDGTSSVPRLPRVGAGSVCAEYFFAETSKMLDDLGRGVEA